MDFYKRLFQTTWKYATKSGYIWLGAIISYAPHFAFRYLGDSISRILYMLLGCFLFICGRIISIYTIKQIYHDEPPKKIPVFFQAGKYIPKAIIHLGVFMGIIGIILFYITRKYPGVSTSLFAGLLPPGNTGFLIYIISIIFKMAFNCYYNFVLAEIVFSNRKGITPFFNSIYLMFENRVKIISSICLMALVSFFYSTVVAIFFSLSPVYFLFEYLFTAIMDIIFIVLYIISFEDFHTFA